MKGNVDVFSSGANCGHAKSQKQEKLTHKCEKWPGTPKGLDRKPAYLSCPLAAVQRAAKTNEETFTKKQRAGISLVSVGLPVKKGIAGCWE